MSLLSRLFGNGRKSEAGQAEAETYKDFRIIPEPVREGSGWRVAARIELEIDGEVRVHQMIRADICNGRDEAVALTLRKARVLIDQQGRRIF